MLKHLKFYLVNDLLQRLVRGLEIQDWTQALTSTTHLPNSLALESPIRSHAPRVVAPPRFIGVYGERERTALRTCQEKFQPNTSGLQSFAFFV